MTRSTLLVSAFLGALLWYTQPLAQSEPNGLIPAPEPPPLPQRVQEGEPLEPDITIVQRTEETVYEYRVNGRLRAVRVVQKDKRFPPDYLIDADGDGRLEHRRHDLAPEILINGWVLFSW